MPLSLTERRAQDLIGTLGNAPGWLSDNVSSWGIIDVKSSLDRKWTLSATNCRSEHFGVQDRWIVWRPQSLEDHLAYNITKLTAR